MPEGQTFERAFKDDRTLSTLSDGELDVELTIAAMALVPRRLERYELLLAERDRRRTVAAGELVH